MMKRFLAAVIAVHLSVLPAYAQLTNPANRTGAVLMKDNGVVIDGTNPLPVSGSFSSTISGFAPGNTWANLSVTGTSANVAMPAGTVVEVTNDGATDIAYRLSVGASTALTTDKILKSGATTCLTVGSNTFINAITASSTSHLSMQGGAGLCAGYGGGGSGGGGGAVTNAGTFAVQAAQSGTWTVQPGNTANTTAWKVDGSAVTQPVSIASVPSHAVTNAGTFAVQNSAATPAGTNVIGKVSAVDSAGTDATDTTNHAIKVNVVAGGAGGGAVYGPTAVGSAAANPPVLMAGTANAGATGNVQVAKINSSGEQYVNVVNNGVALGAAIAGQTPSTIAAQALTANPTAYTTATTNPITTDVYGSVVTQPYALSAGLVKGTTSAMTGTTSTSLVAAPGAGLKNYITTLSCVNSHATVGTFVTVQDGSGGTAIWTVAAAALFGGTAITFPAPLQQPTANTALFVADVTTGANVICSASGYKAP